MTRIDIDFTICDRMRKARSAAGMTQFKLAELLGVDANTVGNWEKDPTPNIPRLIAWAYFTGCPVDWLAGKDIEIHAPTAGFEPATLGALAQVVPLASFKNATNDPLVAA